MAEYCKQCDPHPKNTGLEDGEFCEKCGTWVDPTPPSIFIDLITFVVSLFKTKKSKQ